MLCHSFFINVSQTEKSLVLFHRNEWFYGYLPCVSSHLVNFPSFPPPFMQNRAQTFSQQLQKLFEISTGFDRNLLTSQDGQQGCLHCYLKIAGQNLHILNIKQCHLDIFHQVVKANHGWKLPKNLKTLLKRRQVWGLD